MKFRSIKSNFLGDIFFSDIILIVSAWYIILWYNIYSYLKNNLDKLHYQWKILSCFFNLLS
jgi:hypothetical protein